MINRKGVEFFMTLTVKRKKDESKEEMIARFRKLFIEEGIIEEFKKNTVYTKPSRKRYIEKKDKMKEARARRRHNY